MLNSSNTPTPNLPRVLLDECLPKKLKREFVNCSIVTVPEMGWAGQKNGELMKVARDQFEVFVTADRNLQFQQNLAYAEIGVIVLIVFNNRIEPLTPLMPQSMKSSTRFVLDRSLKSPNRTINFFLPQNPRKYLQRPFRARTPDTIK